MASVGRWSLYPILWRENLSKEEHLNGKAPAKARAGRVINEEARRRRAGTSGRVKAAERDKAAVRPVSAVLLFLLAVSIMLELGGQIWLR